MGSVRNTMMKNINKYNSKRAYQLVKDLTTEKQCRSSTIQDRSGKCLTEEQEISADGQNIAQGPVVQN